MPLVVIHREFLDYVWPAASEMLGPAVAQNHGEATLDQVRADIAGGRATLVAWEQDEEPQGFAVVEFIQHPNKRVAHISYIGGRSVTNHSVLSQIKDWCRANGASELRALCDEAHAKLFARVGLHELYRMVGVQL